MRVLPHTDSPTPVVASGASLRSEHAVARMAPGLHLIGDLYGCRGDARLMTDAPTLEAFCKQAVADAGLTTVGSLFHSFGHGEGVTGAVVLAESHLAVHTWPEQAGVTLDIYVCNFSRDNRAGAEAAYASLREAFQPGGIIRRDIERGLPTG